MLQRAASNAYSWWWASHIRTKQSKWLDQSLQDMEEKVQYVLKMLQEDGDSFARRAEMYYKKRPELTSFVEESYRAFRALAERYDHLSKELQNANSTLATVFPEQFQMGMDEDDDMSSPKPPRKFPQFPIANAPKVPDVPKAPLRDWKNVVSASKQLQVNKPCKKAAAANKTVQKSGLTKDEALEEIDSLQKEILSLQTVKEFVKSSYQSGLAKYRGIEDQIEEKQQKLCSLQDEFGVNKVIEDDVARTLMAEAALKSCEETLAQLQEKQDKYNQEAREENKKIQDARQKLEAIRRDVLKDKIDKVDKADAKKESASPGEPQNSSDQLGNSVKERGDSKASSKQKKIEGNIDGDLSDSLTVTQLAEKIDELVNKVINLETAISSQTVLIDRMRTEATTLHSQIHVLEEDKANLIDGTQELRTKVQKMEEKLDGIQDLNRDVESRNSNLQTHFAEARSSLDHLSEQLSSVKPDEDEDIPPQVVEEKVAESDNHMQQKTNHHRQRDTVQIDNMEEIKEEDPGTPAKAKKESKKAVKFREPEAKETLDDESSIQNGGDHKKDPQPVPETSKEGDFDWQKMLLSGVEDKEKVLLKEYTQILRNYKDTKKRMVDMQKKDRDQEFEVTVQIRELKSALVKRDEEIQRLRQRLSALQENTGEDKDVSDGLSSNNEAKTNLRLPSIDIEDEDFKLIFVSQPTTVSATEEKLRLEIDAILDENLDFWLRFSTSYHQIEKFKTSIQDLQDEIAKLNEKRQKQEENGTVGGGDLKSEARPIFKHLKEIQAELTMWTEQSAQLRSGLENRFSSLCNIQEKITNALKEGVEEDEIRFSSHHAAKFQGEILNMKQENNKVRDELQTGIDHISTLQFEIDKTLRKLNEDFELSGDQNTGGHPRVPLRSFIFGTKQKKKSNSIFSYMHTNRKYQNLRTGVQ